MSFCTNPNLRIISHVKQDKGYALDIKSLKVVELNLDATSLLTSNLHLLQTKQDKYRNFIDFAYENNLITNSATCTEKPTVNYIDTEYHLKKIQFEITSSCNLNCQHCFHENLNSPNALDLPLERVEQIIKQAADLGVIDFYITGGEPLLRKGIYDVLTCLNANKIRSGIFTNGVSITEKTVKRFVDANVSYIQLSLDGHKDSIHDTFRGIKGSFKKTVRAVKLLKETNIPVSVTVVINSYNIDYLKEIVDFLTDDLQVHYGFDRLIPYGNVLKNNKVTVDLDNVVKKVKELMPEQKQLNTLCMENYSFVNDDYTPPYCGIGYDFMYINFKGDILSCPTITPKNYDYHAYNVKKSTLKEAWVDKKGIGINKFRKLQCKDFTTCKVSDECVGGCRSNALIEGQDIDDIDNYMCKLLGVKESK